MGSPAAPPPAPSGVLIAGRYLLDRRVGRGGMAEVWSAIDQQLDRRVAVKWLRSNLAADPVVAERFRREAMAVASLSHPNIVAVHDVCEHEGRQAVVMQLVDGKSLRTLLDSQKRLGPELTIHIGACIAGALHEAHRAGFVHRDVKPGNILVTSDGRVLLTDFGIAKALGSVEDDLTNDNVMMGTAKYLSPEQVRGRKLDGRADLYSLGIVLYECLAGRVPFLGETDADTALARLQRDATDLGHLRPTLPIGLVNLIHRVLARNPAHRPQTGNELRAALLAVDTTPPVIDGTPAEPPARIANPPTTARGAGPGRPGRVTPLIGAGGPARPTATATASAPGDGIPGEPHVARPARPRDSGPRDTPRELVRDATPQHTGPLRVTPSRRDEQHQRSAQFVIGALLVGAVLAALTFFVLANRGERAPADLPSTTVTPGDAAATPASAAPVAAEPDPSGPVAIAGVRAWDPYGDNGTENDAQAPRAVDGDPATTWATECYQDQYLGAKGGVGLVVDLTRPAAGTITVDVASGPYELAVYATDAREAPTDPSQWTPIGTTAFADAPGRVERSIDLDATHVLLWLTRLGPDDACTSSNPYRGQIAEVAYDG